MEASENLKSLVEGLLLPAPRRLNHKQILRSRPSFLIVIYQHYGTLSGMWIRTQKGPK
jgi:hypothetical protein